MPVSAWKLQIDKCTVFTWTSCGVLLHVVLRMRVRVRTWVGRVVGGVPGGGYLLQGMGGGIWLYGCPVCPCWPWLSVPGYPALAPAGPPRKVSHRTRTTEAGPVQRVRVEKHERGGFA